METLIVLGACCVPLAAGVVGLVAWGNRAEKPGEKVDARKPVDARPKLGQRFRRWRKDAG